jgi:putative FmdB family regulatory protein
MPTYEYVCDNCGDRTTFMRGFDEPEQEYSCELCKSTLTRIWTAPGLHFKGGGWGGQG